MTGERPDVLSREKKTHTYRLSILHTAVLADGVSELSRRATVVVVVDLLDSKGLIVHRKSQVQSKR